MPRKVTAYGCKFKCGHRITSKKSTIDMHERKCFSNPDTKSCKTCCNLMTNPYFFDEDYCRESDDQYIECKKDFFMSSDTETFEGGCNLCGATYSFKMKVEFNYESYHHTEVWRDQWLKYKAEKNCPLCPDQRMNRFELMDFE